MMRCRVSEVTQESTARDATGVDSAWLLGWHFLTGSSKA
jgi:hypothetical protein